MDENKIKVYIQVDNNNLITNIESSISESYIDFSKDWICIDEGYGDKYSHAQGNYFTIDGKKTLRDITGKCNYKYINSEIVELTDEEKETLYPPVAQQLTKEELLQKQLLETQNLILELQYKLISKDLEIK
ncbi:hypothetical protein [Clostridium sp. ZBS18]|uniref:hypothetical protein n=1 Tax=Clostridium sp. ZBS18 TaxID=2949967 RepID=UPI00207969B3|nr:hypothetical protein [Clostridium sp. ZBS18]